MTAIDRHAPRHQNDLPLLRRRLRRAGDADGDGGAAIAGDPEHPANFGRLCSKGSALGETLGPGGPAALSDDPRKACSTRRLEDALDHVARRMQHISRATAPTRSRSTSPASC